MLRSNVEKDVRKLMAAILEKDPNEIDPDAHFVNDLGMYPLLMLDIMVGLEMKYKIFISDENLLEFTTVNKSVEIITKILYKKLEYNHP